MLSKSVYADSPQGLTDDQLRAELASSLSDVLPQLRKVLILPPDYTRYQIGRAHV